MSGTVAQVLRQAQDERAFFLNQAQSPLILSLSKDRAEPVEARAPTPAP